jgi:hypothetical protein
MILTATRVTWQALQIRYGFFQQKRLIFELPKPDIAIYAEQSSDQICFMAVVYAKIGAARRRILAQGAKAILGLQHSMILVQRQAIVLTEPSFQTFWPPPCQIGLVVLASPVMNAFSALGIEPVTGFIVPIKFGYRFGLPAFRAIFNPVFRPSQNAS